MDDIKKMTTKLMSVERMLILDLRCFLLYVMVRISEEGEMVESRYMEFDKIGDTGKTEVWNIISKSSGFNLGQIKWYGAWRAYCFYPSPHCIFNISCMDDIKKMITELMSVRRGR